jgi:hypothetical protein
MHDRALVALARGRRTDGIRLLRAAEAASRAGAVPCFRMRLCEDLLELLPPSDPLRPPLGAETARIAERHRLRPRSERAPWLLPLGV